jgi:chemotaxis protein MotB
LAEYFSDAEIHTGPPGGAGGILDGFSMIPSPPMVPSSPLGEPMGTSLLLNGTPAIEMDSATTEPQEQAGGASAGEGEEQDQTASAAAAILAAVQASQDLHTFVDSLAFDSTPEGLRIHLLDRDQLAMFPIGSDAMYPHTRRLLAVVVAAVAKMQGRLSIRGHTDALPFAPGAVYDNWALSSDRANATRRAMLEAGLDPDRVAEVVGKGDADPLIPENRADPRNRRISIVLLRDPPAAESPPNPPALALPPL